MRRDLRLALFSATYILPYILTYIHTSLHVSRTRLLETSDGDRTTGVGNKQASSNEKQQSDVFIPETWVPNGYNCEEVNPFSTAVPIWGQTSLIPSVLSQKRDCSTKRVNKGGGHTVGHGARDKKTNKK